MAQLRARSKTDWGRPKARARREKDAQRALEPKSAGNDAIQPILAPSERNQDQTTPNPAKQGQTRANNK